MVSGNTIGGTIPHTSKMDDGHPSLLMNFENKKENGWTARFVGMVGGIRRRSYSNEKMDTKAKGAIAPDSSKSALLLNQHPFFIAVWWLLSGMVQRTASTLILVRLLLFFPPPTVYSPSPFPPSPSPRPSFSSLLLSYTRLPSSPGGGQGWIFDHERASEFQISAILVVVIRADRNSWGSTCDIGPLAPR